MRVGIDVRAVQFGGGLRGTGRYVHSLLKGLTSLENDTQYVLFYLKELPFPEQLKQFLPRASVAEVEGAPKLESRYPWYQSRARLRTAPLLPDIYWHSYYKAQSRAFVSAARQEKLDLLHLTAGFDHNVAPVTDCPIRTIYTFLDAVPIIFPDQFYDRWPLWTRRLYDLQKSAFQSAGQIVGISDCSRNDAVHLYGIQPEKAHRVYCALESDFSTHIDEKLIEQTRKKFRLSDRYFAFCSVADRHKGVESLIRALSDLRAESGYPFQLAVIGWQNERLHARLRDLCFDAGLNGHDVVVTGYVSDEELRALYKGSVALVSPSRYEGFGYPAAEALAIGTPVIASDRSSLPEVVGDAGLLVDPENVGEIVAAMLRLSSDESLRNDLILRGRDRVKMFDCKRLGNEMWEIYRLAAG